jgi:hypothetical protein
MRTRNRYTLWNVAPKEWTDSQYTHVWHHRLCYVCDVCRCAVIHDVQPATESSHPEQPECASSVSFRPFARLSLSVCLSVCPLTHLTQTHNSHHSPDLTRSGRGIVRRAAVAD